MCWSFWFITSYFIISHTEDVVKTDVISSFIVVNILLQTPSLDSMPLKAFVFAKSDIPITDSQSFLCWHLIMSTLFLIKGALSGLRQIFANWKPLKIWKMLFISSQKLFLFWRYLSFCFDFLVMYQNSLIKKIRFYDVTVWLSNNCNTNIAQYLEK